MATKELFVIAFDLGGVIFARHNDNRFLKRIISKQSFLLVYTR